MKNTIRWICAWVVLLISVILLAISTGCTAGERVYVEITGDLATIPIAVADVTDLQTYLDAKASITGAENLTNKTITSPVINGTVTTTGLTLPAFITSGDIVPTGNVTWDLGSGSKYYAQGYINNIFMGGGYIETAGNFVGQLGYQEQKEMVAPGAGAADRVRTYAVVGGDTLTDLCAVFQDGTVDIFAQEATLKDDVRFKKSSGSKGDLVMLKPHPGLIRIVMLFDDGNVFELKRIEYHDYDLIMANEGCDSDILPDGWLVETAQERQERVLLEEVTVEVTE